MANLNMEPEKVPSSGLDNCGDNLKSQEPLIKVRYVQVLLLFLQITVTYGLRNNLSMAIVAMTSQTSPNPDVPVLDWTNTSIILSSFYWTYAILQFFSGYMGQLHGPKWYMAIAMFVCSIACVITPVVSVSSWGSTGVMICRLVQGVFQGILIPLTHTMLGKWAPVGERSWMNSTVYAGCGAGVILTSIITAAISVSWAGWPASFYVMGAMGFVWCILWVVWGSDSPAAHPRITAAERKHIESSLGQELDYMTKFSTPWKAIFTSLPVWAIVLGAIGESWGNTFLSTEMPSYIDQTTSLDIQSNSLLNSAPYVGAMIVCIASGSIADYFIAKGYTSRLLSRRVFHAIGTFIPAAALIWLAYVSDNYGLIAFLLIVAISMVSTTTTGYMVSIIDITPRFSGIVWGYANGIGQAVAILAPIIVHLVVTDKSDITLWRIVFILAGIIYAATGLFYILFISAEKQWWDDGADAKKDEEKANSANDKIEDKFEPKRITDVKI